MDIKKSFIKTMDSIKNKVSDLTLEIKIQNEFNKLATKFTLYKKENILPITLYGIINDNIITIYGDHNIDKNCIIVNECNKKVYYILEQSVTEIKTKYNNNIYIRKGTIVKVDGDVKEVDAIKIGKKYYLLK